VSSPYAPFKKQLLERGWVENPDFFSPYFDLKYCVRLKDIDYKALHPNQVISHFIGQTCLTNKFELSRSLTNLISDSGTDIDEFFPRCYDINCSYDHMNFLIDFKISFCVVKLKKYLKELVKERECKQNGKSCMKNDKLVKKKTNEENKLSSNKKKSKKEVKKVKRKEININFHKLFSKNSEILICKILVCITCLMRYCDFLENKRYIHEIITQLEFNFLKNENHFKSALEWVNQYGGLYVVEAIDRIKKKVEKMEQSLDDLSDIIFIKKTENLKKEKTSNKKNRMNNNSLNDQELRKIEQEVTQMNFQSQRHHIIPENIETPTNIIPKETFFGATIQEEYNVPDNREMKKTTPQNKKQILSLNLIEKLISHIAWILRRYKGLNPQYNLLDTGNLWIQKPNGLSRGRGIRVFTTLEEIEAYWIACDCEMVVMKYIERPLLIRKRKFDIRVWIVISNLSPLCVWVFDDYYIRLSLNDYNNQDPDNIYAHLTNNSVAKKNKKLYSQIYANSMLTKKQFLEYCKNIDPEFNAKKFHCEMNDLMVHTVESGQFNLVPRKKSYTILGFDLMVDTSFKIWLIEVNSSPSMETNTNVTEKIVPDFFKSLSIAICEKAFVGNNHFSVGTQIKKLRLIGKKKRRFK
jgi:hypothetical protein